MSSKLKLGLLGFGTVGSAFYKLIEKSRTSGLFEDVEITVTKAAVRDLNKARDAINVGFTNDPLEIVNDPDIDIVVEVMGGINPAKELIEKALKNSKPVVSANKEVLSIYGKKLTELAAQNGVDLLYEASVGGAMPVIRVLRESLRAEKIYSVVGILNGTTNYILTEMKHSHVSYNQALDKAMALGYAEPDPTNDVMGFDARAKAAIIANVAFGSTLLVNEILTQGINEIEQSDIEFADKNNFEIKPLVILETVSQDDKEKLSVRVHPALVEKSHPLAAVNGAFNAVFINCEKAGEMMLYGKGAGGDPTAVAILGDVLTVAHNLLEGTYSRTFKTSDIELLDQLEILSQYYLSVEVIDQPGVLARVAKVFGDNLVSISFMEQHGFGSDARLVFITHKAKESSMRKTIKELVKLDCVRRVGTLLRIF